MRTVKRDCDNCGNMIKPGNYYDGKYFCNSCYSYIQKEEREGICYCCGRNNYCSSIKKQGVHKKGDCTEFVSQFATWAGTL